jgi:GNAT superfamily N-acetyltransferase
MIRSTQKTDTQAILNIVEASGQFDASGIAHVQATLEQHLAGNGEGIWLTADDGEPIGVAYCAPEPVASGTWNLLMLWTRSDRHGKGHGASLVAHVEHELKSRAARYSSLRPRGFPSSRPQGLSTQSAGSCMKPPSRTSSRLEMTNLYSRNPWHRAPPNPLIKAKSRHCSAQFK